MDNTVYRLSVDISTDTRVAGLATINGRTMAVSLAPIENSDTVGSSVLPLQLSPRDLRAELQAEFLGWENPGRIIDLVLYDGPTSGLVAPNIRLNDGNCRMIAAITRIETVGPASVGDHRSTPLYEGVTPNGACRFRRRY